MPRYTPDALSAIITEIERQGGAFLPEVCEGRLVSYTSPRTEQTSRVSTCTCKQESMAVVVYDPADSSKGRERLISRGGGFARVCVHCDHVGEWPRFEQALEELET